MRHLVLASVVVIASCKKEAPPAPPLPPETPKVKSALEKVPAGDAVLSVFDTVKGSCEWRRVDAASGTTATVATFTGNCVGASVAFSHDRKRAAVRFDPTLVQSAGIGGSDVGPSGYSDETADEKAADRLFTVELATGTTTPLPQPAFRVQAIGFNAKDDVTALSLDEVSDADVAAGKTLVDGKPFPLGPPSEGIRALAHAWTFSGKAWTRTETKETTTGWDLALETRALDAYRAFAPRSLEQLDTHAGDLDELDPATTKQLDAFKPAKGEGRWGSLGAQPMRVFVWLVSGEFEHSTGRVVLEGKTLAPAEKVGFTDGDLIAVKVRGPFALVASGHAGTHPRAYDTVHGGLLWSSDSARGVTFWP